MAFVLNLKYKTNSLFFEKLVYHQQKLINTLMNGSLELKEEKKRLNKTKKLTLDDKLIDLSWAFNNPDLSDITFVFPGNTSETK
jgi:acetaldehyde dehydrogenase (acetylating)